MKIKICECLEPEIYTDKDGINYCTKCKVETELLKPPNKCNYCGGTEVCEGSYPEGCFLEHQT